jgi:cytochrome bd-type quinol oxidase subunit 2
VKSRLERLLEVMDTHIFHRVCTFLWGTVFAGIGAGIFYSNDNYQRYWGLVMVLLVICLSIGVFLITVSLRASTHQVSRVIVRLRQATRLHLVLVLGVIVLAIPMTWILTRSRKSDSKSNW